MARISKEHATTEIVKSTIDPVYFLNTYGRINHPVLGSIKLDLYKFQEFTIQEFQKKRYNIVLKSRQLGLSTITAGYVWWFMCFNKGKEVVVVANKQKTAFSFVIKIRRFMMHTPVWMRPKIVTDNKGEIELANGSKVTAHATTSDSARSDSASLLIIDEAAIIRTNEVEDLWSAARPTLSTGGGCIMISTPKGVGNFYHRMWVGATEMANNFNPIKLHWTMHPVYAKDLSYDEEGKPTSPWYRNECKSMDSRKIAQELDCVDGASMITVRNIETGVIQTISIETFFGML